MKKRSRTSNRPAFYQCPMCNVRKTKMWRLLHHLWMEHRPFDGLWMPCPDVWDGKKRVPLHKPGFIRCWCGAALDGGSGRTGAAWIAEHMAKAGGVQAHLYEYVLGTVRFEPSTQIPF